MTNKIILESKSLTSKITMRNIKKALSDFVKYSKHHVYGIGDVLYIKDVNSNIIAHAYKESGELVLLVK